MNVPAVEQPGKHHCQVVQRRQPKKRRDDRLGSIHELQIDNLSHCGNKSSAAELILSAQNPSG
jgi:hypothetical protein